MDSPRTTKPTERAAFYQSMGWDLPDWRRADQYEWIVDDPPSLVRWEFVRRSIGYLRFWARWHETDRRGFSLKKLLDPRRSAIEVIDELEFVDERWHGLQATDDDLTPDRIRYARESSIVFLMFDLTRPASEQLKNAKQALKEAKERGFPDEDFATLIVPDKTRLPTYPAKTLRGLDAWDAGENAAEIGRSIFGKHDEDASKAWLRELTRCERYHLLL